MSSQVPAEGTILTMNGKEYIVTSVYKNGYGCSFEPKKPEFDIDQIMDDVLQNIYKF